MDPDSEWFAIAGLWAVAVGWSLWVWIPIGLSLLTGSLYSNGGEENPAAIEPDGTDPGYAALFAELHALGYRPLGSGYMRLVFSGWFWVVRTRVQAFRSVADGQFAFLQQRPFPLTGYHEVYFATCWDDGDVLLTAGGAVYDVRDDGSVRLCWNGNDLAGLRQAHGKAAAARVRNGYEPDPDLSLETLLTATRELAAEQKGANRMAVANTFAAFFMLQPGLTVLVAVFVGFWHWFPPLVAVAMLVFFRVGSDYRTVRGLDALRQAGGTGDYESRLS